MVLMNVAKSEFTFSTPTFAKMAVSAANPADKTAQSLMPAKKLLRLCAAFTNLSRDGDGVPR
jgi:hypothetical protein